MFNSHFLSKCGHTYFRSAESFQSFGPQPEEVDELAGSDESDNEQPGTQFNNTHEQIYSTDSVGPEDDSSLLPSERAEVTEEQPGMSEHGTLVSGDLGDPEEHLKKLRDLLK